MPEVLFSVRWPDGSHGRCYSPSRAIEDFLAPGTDYAVAEFLARSRAGLAAASERVRAKFGMPCARALGQLAEIEARAEGLPADAAVTVLSFQRL
jgi:uncharacterized repeat protein (TIGR04042 family)